MSLGRRCPVCLRPFGSEAEVVGHAEADHGLRRVLEDLAAAKDQIRCLENDVAWLQNH